MTFNQEHYSLTSDCFLNCILGAELPAWMSGYHGIIWAAWQSSLAGKAYHLNTHAIPQKSELAHGLHKIVITRASDRSHGSFGTLFARFSDEVLT